MVRKHILLISILPLVSLPIQFVSTANAEEWNAKCAVFRGTKLIEKAPCKRKVIQQGGSEGEGTGSHIIRYEWQSGGATVTENIEEDFQINGKRGKTVMVQKGYLLCVKNLTSGNTFCTNF